MKKRRKIERPAKGQLRAFRKLGALREAITDAAVQRNSKFIEECAHNRRYLQRLAGTSLPDFEREVAWMRYEFGVV